MLVSLAMTFFRFHCKLTSCEVIHEFGIRTINWITDWWDPRSFQGLTGFRNASGGSPLYFNQYVWLPNRSHFRSTSGWYNLCIRSCLYWVNIRILITPYTLSLSADQLLMCVTDNLSHVYVCYFANHCPGCLCLILYICYTQFLVFNTIIDIYVHLEQVGGSRMLATWVRLVTTLFVLAYSN